MDDGCAERLSVILFEVAVGDKSEENTTAQVETAARTEAMSRCHPPLSLHRHIPTTKAFCWPPTLLSPCRGYMTMQQAAFSFCFLCTAIFHVAHAESTSLREIPPLPSLSHSLRMYSTSSSPTVVSGETFFSRPSN